MTLVIRRPFVGEIITVQSPDNPDVHFDLRRCGVAEHIARQNLSATVRYVPRDVEDDVVTERDYPMGTLRLKTIMFALKGWNLGDENGHPITLSEVTVQQYLSNREFNFLYDKALEVNPMWTGADSEEETKKDS